jgi:hypothetical protein
MIALFGVRMNVQWWAGKTRRNNVNGLEKVSAGLDGGLGYLPPHTSGGEVENSVTFFGCHILNAIAGWRAAEWPKARTDRRGRPVASALATDVASPRSVQ